MSKFEDEFLDIIGKKLLKEVSQHEWLDNWNNKFKFGEEMLLDIYKNLDHEKIKQAIKVRLEEEIADKIVNKIATEYSTDIKELMGRKEIREDLRHYVRNTIEQINT